MAALAVVAAAVAAAAAVEAAVTDCPSFAKAASFRFVGLQLGEDVESSTSRQKLPGFLLRRLCSAASASNLEKKTKLRLSKVQIEDP